MITIIKKPLRFELDIDNWQLLTKKNTLKGKILQTDNIDSWISVNEFFELILFKYEYYKNDV